MRQPIIALLLATVLAGCNDTPPASTAADTGSQSQAAVDAGPAASRPGDPEAGRQLAEQWCSTCHAVATGDTAADVGPAWTAIAADPDLTDEHIETFLAAPHGQMEPLSLSRQQIRDLVAYIRSLGSQ